MLCVLSCTQIENTARRISAMRAVIVALCLIIAQMQACRAISEDTSKPSK